MTSETSINMPMSLRASPTKKSLFEQDVRRPAKRVKTTLQSPAEPPRRSVELFPKLHTSKSRNDDELPIHPSRPLLPKAPVTSIPTRSPQLGSHLYLKDFPHNAAFQVTWIARTIWEIALYKESVEAYSPSLPKSRSCIGLTDVLENDSDGEDGITSNDHRFEEVVNGRSSLAGANLPRHRFTRTDTSFPPLQLDPRLADRVFARKSDDSPNDELRNLCGRTLIQSLSKGSQSYDQHAANKLKAALRGSQDHAPYISALKILANQVEVVGAISQVIQLQSEANVPNSTEVPSLTLDDTSELTTPTETVRSESMDTIPVNTGVPEQTTLVTRSNRSRRKGPAASASGNLPSLQPLHNTFSKLVDDVRRSVTADALTAKKSPNVRLLVQRQSADPLVNILNHTSAVLHEMDLGAAVQYTTTRSQHKSGQNSPSAQAGQRSYKSPLVNPRYDSQYITPYTDFSSNQNSEEGRPYGSFKATSKKESRSPSVRAKGLTDDYQKALNSGSNTPIIPSIAQQGSKILVAQEYKDEDNDSLTEAQIDGFLALANGGNLEADDSETDIDDDLAPLDRERTISRPVTPEKINDTVVSAMLRGVVTELTTNCDHGHGLASLTPQVAYYQSLNRQRFVTELQRYLANAPPVVNVAMSAERSDATKQLYKYLESRVSRPLDQCLHANFTPPNAQIPPPIPHVMPPPGYQVIYHAPGAPPPMATPPLPPVPANAVLSSNAPSLPKLAPAPRKKCRTNLDITQMSEFLRQPDPVAVAEARDRIKQRTRKKGWYFATPRLPIKKADLAIVQGSNGIKS